MIKLNVSVNSLKSIWLPNPSDKDKGKDPITVDFMEFKQTMMALKFSLTDFPDEGELEMFVLS